MASRMLITKIVRTEANRADLYARGHQWPDLKLFELADLYEAGLDPEALEIGKETPCRFWALWEPSDKLNKAGNPYKNIVGLEPDHATAPTEAPELGELLAELRTVKLLLADLLALQGGNPARYLGQAWQDKGEREAKAQIQAQAQASELDQTFPRYGDGSTLGDNPAELAAYNAYLQAMGSPPADVAALREWYKGRNGNGG